MFQMLKKERFETYVAVRIWIHGFPEKLGAWKSRIEG